MEELNCPPEISEIRNAESNPASTIIDYSLFRVGDGTREFLGFLVLSNGFSRPPPIITLRFLARTHSDVIEKAGAWELSRS